MFELQGPAGIGKSRLIEETVARAGDFTVVRSFCEPYESKTPYYAFRFLLRALAGIDRGGEAGGQQLAARVAEVAPGLAPWLPLLATVVDVDVDATPEVDDLEPRFRRQRTRQVVVGLLDALITSPVLLVVEDGQWIDTLSAELLDAVGAEARDRPWVVCVARRIDAGEEGGPAEDHSVALWIGPIDDAAAAALVAEAAGDSPLLPHERDLLVARAGGNPLFLEELVRARRSGTAEEPLPETLEAVVATQIDRLPPVDRRLLRYTSVLGPIFDAALLPSVTEGTIRSASAAVRRFPAFLEPAGPGLIRFRNQCHREVAYDALSFRRRRELHARVGDALEQAGAGAQTDRAGTLSFHFLHAQRYESCWRYARAGAEHARAAYANVEAAALYERALSTVRYFDDLPAGEVASTWECLGDVALLTGAFERARQAFARARRLQSDERVTLAGLCAKEYRAAMSQGRSANGVRWLRRGLHLLEDADGLVMLERRAQLRYLYAYGRLQAGRPAEALRWCSLAQADAERSGDRLALASAYLLQDWALLAAGRAGEANNAPAALAICEEVGNVSRTAEVLLYMGNFALLRGRWNEALELFIRAEEAYMRTGNSVDAACGACNSAEILLFQGRYDEAAARLRSALELWRSMRYSSGEGQALVMLGRLALNRGDVVEATREFEEARAMFGPASDARELDALGGLAECRLREGEVEDALALADDALRRQALSGDTTFAAMLHRVRAYALAALDRLDDAWAEVDESLAVARASGAAYEVALTLEALSVVAELGGLPHDESADAERAALLEQLGILTTPPPPVRVAA
jgi:tetratricopeptide (TPR) repeat protein